METYETDFEICFILFWNGLRIPFLEKNFKICEREFVICFRKVWNGFQNLFHKTKTWKLMKRISKSVSYFSETDYEFHFWKKLKICEREFVICFRKVWNGFQNPFHKTKTWKLMKRISKSVSYFFETDYEFRFWKKI